MDGFFFAWLLLRKDGTCYIEIIANSPLMNDIFVHLIRIGSNDFFSIFQFRFFFTFFVRQVDLF